MQGKTITIVGSEAAIGDITERLTAVREWRLADGDPINRADQVVLEDGRPVAILRTGPDDQLDVLEVTAGGPLAVGPPWRSFKILNAAHGGDVTVVEGRGVTERDAATEALEPIKVELEGGGEGWIPGPRLVVEGDRLWAIVRGDAVEWY